MLEMLDVDFSYLPELFESPEITGKVTIKAAKETGLKQDIPVVAGGGDRVAAAIGNGIVEEGLISYSIGTSGVVYAATERPGIDELGRIDTFCHSVPGMWCLLACINSATASLNWFQEKFLQLERMEAEKQKKSIYEVIEERASSIKLGSDKLFFLPYLAGERHPNTDPNAKGVFYGFYSGHTRDHTLRAVLEGVAYGFRDCLEVMKELKISIKEIRATGGGAKSKLWKKIQVNVNGQTIVGTNTDECGAAYGAAILAGVGVGVYSTVLEACRELVKIHTPLTPDKEEKSLYEKYFRFYQCLYPALKDSYQRLSAL